MPKRWNEEIFRSKCPSLDCFNREVIYWHHYGCPSSFPLFISDTAIIRCEYCGMEKQFLNCIFDCGFNSVEFKTFKSFGKYGKLKNILGILAIFEGIYDSDFIFNLANALRKEFRNLNYS